MPGLKDWRVCRKKHIRRYGIHSHNIGISALRAFLQLTRHMETIFKPSLSNGHLQKKLKKTPHVLRMEKLPCSPHSMVRPPGGLRVSVTAPQTSRSQLRMRLVAMVMSC